MNSKKKLYHVRCCFCNGDDSYFLYTSYENDNYVKCKLCGMVYQNPRTNTDYGGSFWEESIDPDGKVRHLLLERDDKIRNRHKGDITYIHKLNPGKILDVGCGPGFFLSAIDDRWEKHGTDVSFFTANYIKEHYPNIKFFLGELKDADYPPNFFDVVYCFAVIEHVSNAEEIFREIHRITRPNGIVIVSTPNIDSFCARRFKGNYRLLSTPHIALWSKLTLTSLLEKTDFKAFKIKYPFWRTKYFTVKNLFRLLDKSKVSPPFFGNEMTIYARKIGD